MTIGSSYERLQAFIVLLLLLVCLGTGKAEAADSIRIISSCWAPASLSKDVREAARTPDGWTCGTRRFSLDPERVLLRFDIKPDHELPRYLLSRRSALEAVHLVAIDADGSARHSTIAGSSLASSMAGGYFKAPLPDVTQDTRQIIAMIDRPSHEMTLERAYLAPADASDGSTRYLLVLAGLAGMLLTPIFFNAAFYRVLHEPFVLWHSALALSLLMTILVSSGLSVVLFNPPAMTLSWMTTLIFGMTVAAGAMFTHGFIEPDRMHPLLRRLLPCCALWALFLSGFHAAFPFVARPIQSDVYTAAFAPVIVVFIAAVVSAVGRRSRAAKFQAIGYLPLIIVGLLRLITGIVPSLNSVDAMLLFYVGCVFEVFFTTLGVADRFMTMKRERDRARDEADLLERLSETDPLTGLLNRRALESKFGQLRSKGFTTLAILDIDHFKAINDAHGHTIGDEVLKAVARALQPSHNVKAYRLGGEEFVLLLRGGNAGAQAELRRRAIPAIVCGMMPGLGQPVTASMGVADISDSDELAKVYELADKLLYEAKSAGRNRTRRMFTKTLAPECLRSRAVTR